MIPPMNAVLESVMMIATIRIPMIALFTIAFLFIEKNVFIDANFCLKSVTMTGKNAIRKYP